MWKKQRGLSVTLLIVIVIVLVIGGILGSQIVPLYTEYYTILKNAKVTAEQVPSNATVMQVRDLYGRKAEIDYATAVSAEEMEISKEDDKFVLSFAYTKKIHLVHNAYLYFEFIGSTSGTGLSGTKGVE